MVKKLSMLGGCDIVRGGLTSLVAGLTGFSDMLDSRKTASASRLAEAYNRGRAVPKKNWDETVEPRKDGKRRGEKLAANTNASQKWDETMGRRLRLRG